MTVRVPLRILSAALCLSLASIALMQYAGSAAADARSQAEGMLGTTSGEQVYEQICRGCHMPQGRGAQGAGSYPALAGNPVVASASYLAVTILNGRRNMPGFARNPDAGGFFEPVWLSDEQIANVVNHIRSNFGNTYSDPISAAQVRSLRLDAESTR